MSSTLLNAKKLLIVPNKRLSISDYLSLAVLVDLLKKKNVDVTLCSSSKVDTQYGSISAFPEVKTISKVSPRKFIISFDKGADPVKNIQWHQTEDKVSFYISMDKGDFKADGMKLETEGGDYDVVLYFNVPNYQEVEAYFAEFPSLVHEAQNVAIGTEFAIPHSKLEIAGGENKLTVPETIYQMFKGQGTTGEHHTKILAAIMHATKRFKTPGVRPTTFTTCAELMNGGGNIESANSMLEKALSQNPTKPQQKLPDQSSNNGSTSANREAQNQANNSQKMSNQKENQASQF